VEGHALHEASESGGSGMGGRGGHTGSVNANARLVERELLKTPTSISCQSTFPR
jgi:hypothetical protein